MKPILACLIILAALASCGFESHQDRRAREELPQDVKDLTRQVWDLEDRVKALEAAAGIKREPKP